MPNLDISTKRKTCATIVAVAMLTLAVSVTTSQAQTNVYTDPVGFITLTANGTDSPPLANPYASFIALGMTQLPVSRGNATAASANKVAVNASLTAGQFSEATLGAGTTPAYFIELTSGTYAGLLDDITSNDTANVYTADDLTTYLGGGTTYKIYPHWTIGTVFGPQDQAGLAGGSVSSAENIQVWNPNTQGYTVYYYKTTGAIGGTGWRGSSPSVNVTNQQLYIDQGLLVIRKTTGLVNVQLVGGVKLGTTISPVVSGATFIGNVYPAGQPLGSSTLYTGNPATGLTGGSVSSADNIQIWNPLTQGYTVYYYKTTGAIGGTGWRGSSPSVDASTNTIPLGAPALLVRKTGGAFSWFAPQPFTP
jgi:uncharacterized protein (TIGR02597 family)